MMIILLVLVCRIYSAILTKKWYVTSNCETNSTEGVWEEEVKEWGGSPSNCHSGYGCDDSTLSGHTANKWSCSTSCSRTHRRTVQNVEGCCTCSMTDTTELRKCIIESKTHENVAYNSYMFDNCDYDWASEKTLYSVVGSLLIICCCWPCCPFLLPLTLFVALLAFLPLIVILMVGFAMLVPLIVPVILICIFGWMFCIIFISLCSAFVGIWSRGTFAPQNTAPGSAPWTQNVSVNSEVRGRVEQNVQVIDDFKSLGQQNQNEGTKESTPLVGGENADVTGFTSFEPTQDNVGVVYAE